RLTFVAANPLFAMVLRLRSRLIVPLGDKPPVICYAHAAFFWRADAHVPWTEDFQSHLAMAGQWLGQSQEPAGKSHHRAQAGSGQTHSLCPENQLDHRPDDTATVLRGSRPARSLHPAGAERPVAAALCLS